MKKSRILTAVYAVLTLGILAFLLFYKVDDINIYSSGYVPTVLMMKFEEESIANVILYVASAVLSVILPYLFGAGNFAIMISREEHNDDIRKYGSKNAGMTNMIRVYGKKDGALTALGDGLKTSAAIMIGRLLLGESGAYLAALFAVLGHMAPIYYRFKGGKGVIASAIAMLVLNPLHFCFSLAAFCLVFFTTHWVSMGSVAGAFVYPAVVFYGERIQDRLPTLPQMIFACFVGIMVIIMHRANFHRVYNGEESKLYLFKKRDRKGDGEI